MAAAKSRRSRLAIRTNGLATSRSLIPGQLVFRVANADESSNPPRTSIRRSRPRGRATQAGGAPRWRDYWCLLHIARRISSFRRKRIVPRVNRHRGRDKSSELSHVDPDYGRLASALIVRTAEEWSRILSSQGTDGILIPLFDGADVAGAKTIGLTVIVPMGIGDDQNRATLVLPRLDVIAATDCLSTSGVPYDLASTIAQAIDRSLPSFRRTNSVNPTHKRPQWANERSDLVAPLSLLGSWNSDSVDDQEVVSRMTRRNYTDVERDLQRLAAYEDSPFIASGNNSQLVSSEDAFALVGGTLTKGILEVWFAAALDVLHEPNPLDELRPDESLHATIKGVGRRHSTSLRTGIARGAALLGSSGRRLHGAVSVADYARRLVRALLVDGTD